MRALIPPQSIIVKGRNGHRREPRSRYVVTYRKKINDGFLGKGRGEAGPFTLGLSTWRRNGCGIT